jgi:hypothetical protein
LRKAAGIVALHRRRHFDVAPFHHVEQIGRLAIAADRLQRDLDPPTGLLFDGAYDRHQRLIIGRGAFGVDRAETQDDVRSRGRSRRDRKQDEQNTRGQHELHGHKHQKTRQSQAGAWPSQERFVLTKFDTD